MDLISPEEEVLQTEETSQNIESVKQFLLDLLETIILAVVLFFVINAVSARVRVDGFSMVPTLKDGEYILVNRLAYKNKLPERGDIIVFQSPQSSGLDLIKRVIGLPGNHVQVFGGVVQVDGQTLDEPYIAAAPAYNGDWVVPEGHLFVLGDNRNDSSDSHAWGLLPAENVIGKAILIYWPIPEWTLIRHHDSGFSMNQFGGSKLFFPSFQYGWIKNQGSCASHQTPIQWIITTLTAQVPL